MTVTVNLAAADGAKSALTLPSPTVVTGNAYPNPGVWTSGGVVTNTWQTLADLNAVFVPAWHGPATSFTTSLAQLTAPSGPGFSFTVTDAEQALWDSSSKVTFAQATHQPGKARTGFETPDLVGTVCQYTFNLLMPKQTFESTWFCCDCIEFPTSNGPLPFALNVDTTNSPQRPTPVWRPEFRNSTGANGGYDWVYGPPIVFDVWHKMVFQIYWTANTNGYFRMFLNGQLIANHVGQTYWAALGPSYLQYGFYANRGAGLAGRAQFGPVVRQQFAALGA